MKDPLSSWLWLQVVPVLQGIQADGKAERRILFHVLGRPIRLLASPLSVLLLPGATRKSALEIDQQPLHNHIIRPLSESLIALS